MDSPESVYFDAASGFLYSSQIGGDAAAKDGNGRIVKLTLDGKIIDANWITGLNAPKGMRAYRGTLFVADIDEVVAIDIAAGRISSRVKTDAKFLNDLATAPDGDRLHDRLVPEPRLRHSQRRGVGVRRSRRSSSCRTGSSSTATR